MRILAALVASMTIGSSEVGVAQTPAPAAVTVQFMMVPPTSARLYPLRLSLEAGIERLATVYHFTYRIVPAASMLTSRQSCLAGTNRFIEFDVATLKSLTMPNSVLLTGNLSLHRCGVPQPLKASTFERSLDPMENAAAAEESAVAALLEAFSKKAIPADFTAS